MINMKINENGMIKYSDDSLENLRGLSPAYYQLYNLSVFATYFGLLIICWYFINLAYTINTQSYDVLCADCGLLSHSIKLGLLITWLFFLYFYMLNEIRFRFMHFSHRGQEKAVKRNNSVYILSAVIMALLSMLIIL